ncbi:MAG: ADP-dependent NAD(P)H-hydrate dehydratase / NAD(P)H-hydrate epimerase [Acidimicrobiaceae bacterium]|nr:ADP-dependent NAD(P)H-hydrate dehydratase / NAD(P)H-hydrate epimerase [Acidimicrobiaceae bacterium]
MIPVLTVEEMQAVDRAAPEPVEVLIERAGAAVARTALSMLGSGYGKRVVVVAGKGNNGADGRAAARRLERRGVRVQVVEAGSLPVLPRCDLVIDAAFGTGFRGSYSAPDAGGAPVLCVDVPTGGVVEADATVTFAALKPVHLLSDCGVVEVADIGLDVSGARAWLVEDEDVATGLPGRDRDGHKWQTAVFVAAGSPGMMGAPVLVARGAMRAGSGYVRLGVPGADAAALPAGLEAVGVSLPATGWSDAVLAEVERCRALVVGPGLGRSDEAEKAVRRLVAESPVPVVVDADGLNVLGRAPAADGCVLTPHEGEFERLSGEKPGSGVERLGAVRALAEATGATVLLKGSTTIVASPDGRVLFAAAGRPSLATAGTGDVLSGVIGAFLARGLPPLAAAAFAAHVHGAAAGLGYDEGLVAGDLPQLVAAWLSEAVDA